MKPKKELVLIGRAERIQFVDFGKVDVPVRVDTGAKTSALWASEIHEDGGVLSFVLFDKGNEWYDGATITTTDYGTRLVANSSGAVEERYTIKAMITMHGRKIRATFTLANRETQVYPVLIGRNVLRGKFIVDVKQGKPLLHAEKMREAQKRSAL